MPVNLKAALRIIKVQPIPMSIAKNILEHEHYLHSLPGGTKLAFGVFTDGRLMGTITLGVGPTNAHCLVQGATRDDCLALTRFWLSDEMPPNSESRVIAVVLRALNKYTNLKFLVSYADPAHGHLGTIYQASNWLYTGLSVPTELYDFGDGILHHSRSVGQVYGSRSALVFALLKLKVKVITPAPKRRYFYFLAKYWSSRLLIPVLPYPKKESTNANY
jgi:hypothetical protein